MVLRVALVSAYPYVPDQITGGIEGVSQNLARALQQLGDIEVHVVAPGTGRKPRTESRGGILIHWINNPRLPGFIGYWTTYRRAVHHCLKTIGPDVAHFQGIAGWLLGYQGFSVLTVHGIPERDALFVDKPLAAIRHWTMAAVERAGRKHAEHLVVINPYVMETLGSQIGGRTWFIENPVNQDFFEIAREPVAGRVLYVGRISRLKNVAGLIRAFAQVQRKIPGATLHVAGAPDSARNYSECVDEAARQGLAPCVRFLGNIDRQHLAAELSQAQCLALVSLQENAPMVVSESMAAGVPVVASKRCGIPYMVEDGGTGFLVNPLDCDQIAERLLAILENPDLAAAMSRRARELALDRYHVHSVASRTREVYRNVLKQ